MPEPVALQIQTPDSFRTIGSLLNFANQAQALQAGRQNIQMNALELEKRGALLEPSIKAGVAASETAQTGAKSASFRLEADQSAKAMQIAVGMMQDPRVANSDPNGIIDAANEAYSQMVASGVPKNTADFWTSQIKAKAHQPGGALQLLQNVTRAAAGPGTQANVINAPVSMVQTPAGAVAPVQLQPGAAGAVSPVPISSLQTQPAAPGVIPAGIPPSQVQTQATDALGRPAIAEKDQRGNILFKAPQGASYKPLMSLPQGETAQTAAPLFALRDRAQQEAALAPQQHFNNQQILNLAPQAFTGTGSPELAKVLNAVGLQRTNDAGADTAKLRHFLALQIENNAAAQGANTDAARQLAANAVLPTDSPEKAVKAITKINDAYVTGKELFNQGMVKAINAPDNEKDIFAARDFQNAWSANFDPYLMRLYNADRSKDRAEMAAIAKELGADRLRSLLPKYRALKALVTTGRP